jgi:hypothetical protein
MIISHENEFIFIHVPRTAGTRISKSICESLGIEKWREFIGEPRELINEEGNALGEPYSGEYENHESCKHATAKRLRGKICEERWKSYFKFSFVRNPWSRRLSIYLKRRKEVEGLKKIAFLDSNLCFNSYIFAKYGIGMGKTNTQDEFITDESGNVILDYVGRFENLKDDFGTICKKIGVDGEFGSRYDSTGVNNYKKYYTKFSKKLIENRENYIIEKFNYRF